MNDEPLKGHLMENMGAQKIRNCKKHNYQGSKLPW